MKIFTFIGILSLSFYALAEKRVEFDENQEKVCYEEARKAGCVKSAGAAASQACTKTKKAKLPSKCYQVLGI